MNHPTQQLNNICSQLEALRIGLAEASDFLNAAGGPADEIFSKFALEQELVNSNVRDAFLLSQGVGETTSLHMALETAHDSVLWVAAFSIVQWYHWPSATPGRGKFRILSDMAEDLLDQIDNARRELPIVAKANRALH